MKKLLFLFGLIFISCSIFAENDDIEQLIENANQKYAENQFAEAIELYSQVVNLGYESSELYYNLGNAYFKNNKIAHSILYYEKAKLLNPKDEKINHNLRFAQQFVKDEIKAVPKFFLTSFFENIVKIFKTDTWAILSLTFFILTLFSLILMFFSRIVTRKRLAFALAILFFVSSIFNFVMANKMNNLTTGDNNGIIMSVVTIKSSPDDNSTDLFILHEGVKIGITDKIDNWYEIKLLDGRVGWLQKEYLSLI